MNGAKYLVALFDVGFSFGTYSNKICADCFVRMSDLRHIRKYLMHEAVKLVCDALVSSCPD